MSSTAAATNSRPSAPICPQRRRPTPLPPKPLPNQIPIDGQPLTSPRGFFLRRLSDAGPDTAVQVDDRPASETLHESGHYKRCDLALFSGTELGARRQPRSSTIGAATAIG